MQNISAPAAAGAPRVLGAMQLTFLGIGAIVGTGIFVLGGQVAATHAGPAVVLAFGLAGLCAMLAALCYSELASMVATAGTAYVYTHLAFGRWVGFCIGWTLLLVYTLAAASVAVGWSAYLTTFVQRTLGWGWDPRWVGPPVPQGRALCNLPALGIVVALSAVLCRGVRQAARFNTAAVLVKLAAIVAFIVVAAPRFDRRLWQPFVPPATAAFGRFGWSGVLQGTSILFFAYNGFDAISAAAGEARRPQRDIPLAIVAAVLVSGILYMAAAAALTGVAPYADLAVANPLSAGLQAAQAAWLLPWIEAGAIAGLTSVMLVNLYSQPRVTVAMAGDGLLPAPLATLHPRLGTPLHATVVNGVVCGACAALLPIDWLAQRMCAGVLLAFGTVSLATFWLRIREPLRPRPFRVPGPAWGIPLLSAAICFGLLAVAQGVVLLQLCGWVGFGVLVLWLRDAVSPCQPAR